MSIVVQNNQGLLSRSQEASTIIFLENIPAGSVTYNWVLGSATPPPFVYTVQLPDYNLYLLFQNYTDFELHFETSSSWYLVNGANSSTVSMGTRIVENEVVYYLRDLNISFQNLNLLSIGRHYAQLWLKVYATSPANEREMIMEYAYGFNINVQEQFVPNVELPVLALFQDPNVFLARFYRQSQLIQFPKKKYVYKNTPITLFGSPVDYTITDHDFYSVIELDLPLAFLNSLPDGLNSYPLKINSLAGDLDCFLNIEVYDDSVDVDDFTCLPESVEVEIRKNEDVVHNADITVFASSLWNVQGQMPTWLNLSTLSGNTVTNLRVTFQNYNDLNAGVYRHNLVLKSVNDEITIPITMNLIDFVKYPFSDSNLFFTDEADVIEMYSDLENTYFEVNLNITCYKLNVYDPVNYIRKFDIPVFKHKAQFYCGEIVHELFENVNKLDDFVTVSTQDFIKTQYAPAKVDVVINLKQYDADEVIRSSSVNDIMFIKGKKPYVTNSGLAILSSQEQGITSISPKSIIAFSFVNKIAPKLTTFVNGMLRSEKEVMTFSDNILKCLYTYYNAKKEFRVGDYIEIQMQSGNETRIKRYLVLPEGPSSTHVLFENNNAVVESFELKGRVKINGSKTHTTQKKMVNLNEVVKKIHTDSEYSLTINSGQLLIGDLPVIESIIDSKNVWVSLNNDKTEWIQVDCITNKTSLYDDFENQIDIVLEFNILKSDHARIYSFGL